MAPERAPSGPATVDPVEHYGPIVALAEHARALGITSGVLRRRLRDAGVRPIRLGRRDYLQAARLPAPLCEPEAERPGGRGSGR